MPHAVPLAGHPFAMKIVSIEKAAGPDDRVLLCLEAADPVEVARELLLREGLHEGDTVTAEQVARLSEEDGRWRAREAALRLLAHRPRTEVELRQRLMRKGFTEEVAAACVADLLARGLLDDAAFAEMFTRDRVRLNPRGRRRVVQELRGRGVEADVASAAVDDVLREEAVDEAALAREAARRWRPRRGEEAPRARRRLAGYLARRGFGADTVRAVVEELLGAR